MLTAQSLIMLFGIAYATQRGIVEVWKIFIRDRDQSKNRAQRLAAGAGCVIGVTILLFAIAQLDVASRAGPTRLTSAVVGFIGGTIVAIGGAWKGMPRPRLDSMTSYLPPEIVDALSATIRLLAFLRAPSITAVLAVVLSMFSDSHLYIAVAAIGYERAAAATYDMLTA